MADRLRINFTLWTANLSGGTRHIFEVANGLTRRGHDVMITSLAGDHRWFPLEASIGYVKPPPWLRIMEPLVRVVKRRGVRYLDIDTFTKLLGLKVNIDLITPLAEAIPECDANVATFCLTAPAVCRSGQGTGFYYIQHYEPPFFQDSRDILAARETYHLPLKKIVTSAWLERLVYRMTGERAVARVGIGLNPGVFYPRPVRKNTGEKVVMALIRGIKWKNELEILKVMNIVAGEIPGVKLLAVGREKAFTELARKVRPGFRIDFRERVDDDLMARLFSSADVFISTSRFEGGNSPPLEAMACGTPVVVYRAPWNEDFIVNQGKTKNALVARDTDEFARHVAALLADDDLPRKLRENGLETARRHTWDAVTDRVEAALLKEVAASAR